MTRGGVACGAESPTIRREPVPTDPVRRVMARRPGRVPQAATLREAARELTDAEIGAVVVEGSGGTVGLISVRDVLPVLVRSRW